MLIDAAEKGCFSFENVSYEQFMRFLKKHSPNLAIQIGARSQAFIDELHRLAAIANETRSKKILHKGGNHEQA